MQVSRSPLRKKSSDFPPSPPKASANNDNQSIHSHPNFAEPSNTSKQCPLRSYDKTPKKVGKSTKNHLGKMLVGVVMFNRGVKVGGQAIND